VKWVGVVLCLVALGALALSSEAAHLECHTGQVTGFATIRSQPQYLVGTIPSTFSSKDAFFTARYNCRGRGVHVRRVDQGVYDVRFRGAHLKAAFTDAISTEGVSSSAQILGDTVRVSLRGPLNGGDVASRRDVAFSVVTY
jgi:hypothetical protein